MTPDLLKPTQTLCVWIFLTGATDPVVAGRVDLVGPLHRFTYGKSYLRNSDAIPIFLPELPLVEQVHVPAAPLQDVLLIMRFDRIDTAQGWTRRAMVSAFTSLELSGLHGRYASYEDLATHLRKASVRPSADL